MSCFPNLNYTMVTKHNYLKQYAWIILFSNQVFSLLFAIQEQGITCKMIIILLLQPRKDQLSNSQVSDNSKSVVKDKKLTVHNSCPGTI